MEVLDLIYHLFFFTTNILGRQPTTSQFLQPLTPQTLALVAAAIHCVLSEYATGKKVTVMFSQDESRGKFCPSTVIDWITADAIALITITHGGAASGPPPQWCSSAIIGAPHPPSALLSVEWRIDISFRASYCLFSRRSSSRMGAAQSPPQPSRIEAPLFHSRLVTSLRFQRCSALMGCSAEYALLNPRRRSLAWIFAPQFHLALLHHHQHSPCWPQSRHQALLHSWWHTSFSPEFVIFAFQTPFWFTSCWPQFQSFRYHKSSQTTLEFNFTHSPGRNHLEIQEAPPASLRHWWILYSCVCRPWWDGRFSGWDWDYVRLHSHRLIGLMFRFYLHSFLNHSSFSLVLLNVAMQTIECWMRCWVL